MVEEEIIDPVSELEDAISYLEDWRCWQLEDIENKISIPIMAIQRALKVIYENDQYNKAMTEDQNAKD